MLDGESIPTDTTHMKTTRTTKTRRTVAGAAGFCQNG
jgi:hypothetical protein